MSQIAIIYPAIAMFFLTFFVFILTGRARFAAVKNGDVHPAYFKEYNRGELHGKVQVYSRHMQNHFEVPPIFYAVILFTFVTQSVTMLAVGLAWGFFGLRCLHSFIHLTSNHVIARFSVFGVSLVILTCLWINLLVAMN